MKYKDLSQLLTILGYVDPYPNAGKWNKKAQKARRAAIDKLNIEQYRIGSYADSFEDGYIRVPIYEYKNVKYA